MSTSVASEVFPFEADAARVGAAPLFVDASPLAEKRLTGIGRFVARMIEGLARMTDLRLFTAGSGRDIPIEARSLPEADLGIERWVRHLMSQRQVPHDDELARECAGVYGVLRPGVRHFRKELGILYDFTTLILPWAHVPQTREHFCNFFVQSSVLCDNLIAISRSTKRDASWLCEVPNEDVVVAYPGPSMCVRRHAHTGPVERQKNVILVVSTLEPRKNGPFLLDWFSRTDVLSAETELWWVGPRGWWASKDLLQDLTRRRGGQRGSRVRFLGMVPDDRLCELYRQAAFTIYPSLYEGFGLPVLDSLMHGAPVLCSYNSSLAEFDCPGVFYFDAGAADSLDEACRRLLALERVAIDSDDLRHRFSWDKLAQTVLGLCN